MINRFLKKVICVYMKNKGLSLRFLLFIVGLSAFLTYNYIINENGRINDKEKRNILALNQRVAGICRETSEMYSAEEVLAVICNPVSGKILCSLSILRDDKTELRVSNKKAKDICDIKFDAGNLLFPISVGIALQNKIIGFADTVDCKSYANRIAIRDYAPHGSLTSCGIITKKSFIGFAKILDKMNGLDLTGEFGKFGINYKRGSGNEFLNAFSARCSPFEIIQAYSILANRGKCLYDFVNGDAAREEQVLSASVADSINKALSCELQEIELKGTPPAAMEICGKAGSGPIFLNDFGKGYYSYMAGFAPAQNPRFVAFIMVVNPKENKPAHRNEAALLFNNIIKSII
jgi:cell division protein FtsI (penicillin-binding protein 3)